MTIMIISIATERFSSAEKCALSNQYSKNRREDCTAEIGTSVLQEAVQGGSRGDEARAGRTTCMGHPQNEAADPSRVAQEAG